MKEHEFQSLKSTICDKILLYPRTTEVLALSNILCSTNGLRFHLHHRNMITDLKTCEPACNLIQILANPLPLFQFGRSKGGRLCPQNRLPLTRKVGLGHISHNSLMVLPLTSKILSLLLLSKAF